MLEYIAQSHKRGLDVFVLSKDIEKAFDKVHHPSLIYKIFNNFNLPELFCKTLANFLVNRSIEIKINGICSDPFSPESGVYKFILSNVPHDQHPNSEYMHVKMRLKSVAQVAWERGRNFHKRLRKGLPDLYNMCEEYTQLPIVKTRPSTIRC